MIELETLIDLYREEEVEVEGETVVESKLVAEDLVIKRLTSLEGLYPSQMYKESGELYTDRVRVYDDSVRDTYIVKTSYEELKDKILKTMKIGFKK